MTNSHMVKPSRGGKSELVRPTPNRDPLPLMPATEGSPDPVTDREPMDSPQPKPQLSPGKAHGLTTGEGE